ncbi:hypothetical protein RN001_004588 [Aquatica leii]|uniref:DUF4806 domain-containing protein n=1 Tax=Aquatica leii TaxID=1421715 RepID=A0AAN7PYP3_9COLE|nr:hypothetical protein RN001_004588 [Aquatica leii]
MYCSTFLSFLFLLGSVINVQCRMCWNCGDNFEIACSMNKQPLECGIGVSSCYFALKNRNGIPSEERGCGICSNDYPLLNYSSFNDEVQLTNETIKTMPIIMIDHDITNLHQSSDLSQPSVTSFRALSRQSGTSDSNSEVQNDTTAFERQVMRQLVLLNAKVNQQTETLNYILEKLNQGTAVPLQNQEYTNFLQSDFFPIGSIEALENMEEQLQDEAKKKQLIIDLKKLGGEDTKKMIRRMLERLLTFKLGSMYTWDGARGKRVFGTLSISQVTKSACATTQRHNTTEDEVERFIKEWLRRAKDRCIQTEKKKVCKCICMW